MADEPRGVRNNNPGNLRKNDTDKWQGLAAEQTDESFFVFREAVYGIRALARTLISYQDAHDLSTVTDFINRWAPPVENNTNAYVSAVCADAGFSSLQVLNVHCFKDLFGLVKGVIHHENGCVPYTDAQITKGLVLAGVEPPKKSLIANPQVIGSALAGAATVAQPVVANVQANLQQLTDYSDSIKHAFIIVALIGVGLAAWAKIDERLKGIS